jgi:hypothetical protein
MPIRDDNAAKSAVSPHESIFPAAWLEFRGRQLI